MIASSLRVLLSLIHIEKETVMFKRLIGVALLFGMAATAPPRICRKLCNARQSRGTAEIEVFGRLVRRRSARQRQYVGDICRSLVVRANRHIHRHFDQLKRGVMYCGRRD